MSDPIKLPSGAELKITLAPFKDAKVLYQAILEEIKPLKLDPKAEVDVNLFKDLFCYGFSSQKVEKALDECLKRCLYNSLRVDKDTFEPEEARQDYMTVCIEVTKANIMPFIKPLFAQFSQLMQMIPNTPEQK